MRYHTCMRRLTVYGLLVIVLFVAVALSVACGDGGKPAVEPTTLLPGAGGGPPGATPNSTPGSTPNTLSPGATPTATGGGTVDQITDDSIKANIMRRIAESAALAGLRIQVDVEDRVVALRGNVRIDAQKKTAQNIAVTEPGIVKVVSYLIVDPKGDGGY